MKDIILDENNDLTFENGDLQIGDSESQHIKQLALLNKGDLKEYPLTGLGIRKYLKKTTLSHRQIIRDYKVELGADGFTNIEVSFNADGELEVTDNTV